ncbi:TPA_asm: hypothetical protein [Porphyromonas phage phage018a_AFR5B1]|uniref:Uncharacterized protein n=1 Tax=Porphyromonas phage phage018a_AFR5B1 TaxID=3154108 RepID=A0AAT9JBW7_9CAUD
MKNSCPLLTCRSMWTRSASAFPLQRRMTPPTSK